MDNIGEIIGVIIFIIISILSSLSEKNKKKKNKTTPGTKTTPTSQQPSDHKKEKSPLELLEEMFNEPKVQEPVYIPPKVERPVLQKPEPSHSMMKKEPKIDLPEKKKYIRKRKYATNANYLRKKLENPDSIRDLIVTAEILGKPKALQD